MKKGKTAIAARRPRSPPRVSTTAIGVGKTATAAVIAKAAIAARKTAIAAMTQGHPTKEIFDDVLG